MVECLPLFIPLCVEIALAWTEISACVLRLPAMCSKFSHSLNSPSWVHCTYVHVYRRNACTYV